MILLYCFRVPTVAEMVEHNFDDLDVGVVNPRATLFVEAMCACFSTVFMPMLFYGLGAEVTSKLR